MRLLQRTRGALSSMCYRFGWDTRCRNVQPARLLRSRLNGAMSGTGPALLDVGSGSPGLSAFLRDVRVVGLDTRAPTEGKAQGLFVVSDATALPFHAEAVPAVTCIDVLEHMIPEDRIRVIKEMVRVAASLVLIAFPDGARARSCDLVFHEACQRRSRPIPEWLKEHLTHEYPDAETTAEQIRAAAEAAGRHATITLTYCEPLRICRLVRAAASRSNWLYAMTNLAFGVLLPIIPVPDAVRGYRTILLAELFPKT